MTLNDKLVIIQSTLKAPKSKTNSFANFKYRSCEDILEAVKPLLKEQGLTLVITDSIEMIGTRFYVRATAWLRDGENEIIVHAYAREPENKKGSDESQITGAASSYARKYALNGLFLIDDTQDADSEDNTKKGTAKTVATTAKPEVPATSGQLTEIQKLAKELSLKIDPMPTNFTRATVVLNDLIGRKAKLSKELDSKAI